MKRTRLLPTLRSPISLLINLCFLFFSFLPRKSFGVDNPYFQACGVHSTCGDGQNISFPFYIQDKPRFLCGYPGFQLSCNNNGQPTINISNGNYTIHNISYESHILRVSNAAFSNSTDDCIPLAENISLHGIRFELAPYQSHVHLLYGCNSSLQLRRSALDFYPCCDGGNKNVPVLALHERDPKLRYVSEECTTRVVAPVEAHGGDIRESLRSGFLVKWKASDCSICKESGGRCGFDRMTYLFKCFCPDRPHASHCHPAVTLRPCSEYEGISQIHRPRPAFPSLPFSSSRVNCRVKLRNSIFILYYIVKAAGATNTNNYPNTLFVLSIHRVIGCCALVNWDMASVSALFVFFLLSYLVLLLSAQQEETYSSHNCRPLSCGDLESLYKIGFPFANTTHPKCGHVGIVSCNKETKTIQLAVTGERQYEVTSIRNSPEPNAAFVLGIRDQELSKNLSSVRCESIKNLSSIHIEQSPSISFEIESLNWTFVKCDKPVHDFPKLGLIELKSIKCRDNYHVYHHTNPRDDIPYGCSIIQLPIKPGPSDSEPYVTGEFELQVNVSDDCIQCREKEQCQIDRNNCPKKGMGYTNPLMIRPTKGKSKVLVIALSTVGCSAIVIIIIIIIIYKKKNASTNFLARNTNAVQSSRSDLEGGSVYFGVHLFPYSELQEATNNFDDEKELGDGGSGIVYYGKLHDGREVAVKRLYERNCRQVQQFINEVEILTRMRHKNLVSLYGCTSRRSRELLLVYEYIPNGTVADHIHGERATAGSLPWPTRMSIAIETASALAYLHASEIIHRDVKTNNILLDNNFCVKVADFGLSRLFPIDVSHVSTGPQGTPGYVDPEYHECYQLTKKSDVYSFGVVLIELISSLPAVDITRHRHEINLANLAVNKIEQRALHELIDPHLGFQSDDEVKRMTISVASLAFQCIQEGKELRPSMEEVLEALKGIQSGKDAGTLNVHPPTSPDCDEVGLLKKRHELPPSPSAVTDFIY